MTHTHFQQLAKNFIANMHTAIAFPTHTKITRHVAITFSAPTRQLKVHVCLLPNALNTLHCGHLKSAVFVSGGSERTYSSRQCRWNKSWKRNLLIPRLIHSRNKQQRSQVYLPRQASLTISPSLRDLAHSTQPES